MRWFAPSVGEAARPTGSASARCSDHADQPRLLAAYATLRAPFTRFQRDSGFGEVEEAARGAGLQRALGELLVCPECLGQWVAAGLVGLFAAQPEAARAVAATMTVYAAADAMQLSWARAREAAKS